MSQVLPGLPRHPGITILGLMNEEDSKLFQATVGDVEPLRRRSPAVVGSRPEITPGTLERRRQAARLPNDGSGNYLASAEFIPRVKPMDPLSFKRDGVQHGVFKNLRQGKYGCDVQLDLHRMTVAQAREAVFEFIREAVAADVRCALINHGKGQQQQQPALLKSCVNHWLREMDQVLAFHSAPPGHGGLGACYVLLRKSENKRQENREKFSKRGGR